MAHNNRRRRALTGALLAGALALSATPAAAATGSGSFSATCDPGNYGYGTDDKAWQHSTKGTLKIKQTGDSPLSSSVTATSQNGNSLAVSTIKKGGTASWSNVLAGQYKVKARLSGTHDCNGILPGKGNYTFAYTITY